MPTLPPTITRIQATIAHKMDESPRVVSEWRLLWKTWTVRLNALGAALSFLFATALSIAPLLGIVWASPLIHLNVAMWITGVLFSLAVVARYLKQPGLREADDRSND